MGPDVLFLIDFSLSSLIPTDLNLHYSKKASILDQPDCILLPRFISDEDIILSNHRISQSPFRHTGRSAGLLP
jgi:hypothetical protein